MTVIACKDGVMAADTGVWNGDIIIAHIQKIVRLKDGRLFAAAGPRADILACVGWLDNGDAKPEAAKDDDFGAVILGPSGIERVDYKFRCYPAAGAVVAEGAHTDFMLGAMMMGATAEEAVRLAISAGSWAAGEVQIARL